MMEQAQNLQVGDPQSGEPEVIIESILKLLTPFLPQFRLFVLLHGEGPSQPPGSPVFYADGENPAPTWVRGRAEGSAVWIPFWMELPQPIKLALADWGPGPARDLEPAAPFFLGLALPLETPTALPEDATVAGTEAGLLFLIPQVPFDRTELFRVGCRVARFVAHRWRYLQEVNKRIHSDSLTGVHNRAFFDLQFVLELERAKRRDSSLVLILADLDHFKQINDRYGHQAGDEVLKRVAGELVQGLRRIDQVCRIGGEEFALILPNTDAEAAQEVVGRLLASLAKLRLSLADLQIPLPITLSFGGVSYPEGGSDPFELYRKADAMLYLSKEAGRNRCHFWNPQGEPTTLLPGSAGD
jgi:diguanylate cyclase (GGDEF)-like protein